MTSPDSKPIAVAVGSRGGSARKTTPRKATPKAAAVSEKELVEALADCLAVGLAAYFQYLAKVDPRDRAALEMTDDEATAIVTPLGKLIEKHASAQAAGFVAGSKDWIVAIAAIMAYTDRAIPILQRNAETRRVERQQRTNQARQQSERVKTNGNLRSVEEPATVGVPGAGYGLGVQHTID